MSRSRETKPERAHSREAAVALAHGLRYLPCRLEVVAREVDVEGDQRRPCADEDAARPLVERRRPEVRADLAGVDAALQLGRSSTPEEGRPPARSKVGVEEDRQRQLLPHSPRELERRGASTLGIGLPDRDERDDVGGADARVGAFVSTQVDPLPSALDAREQCGDELLFAPDDRVHAAVVVCIRMDVEQACGPASASPIASIVARSRPSEKFGTASSGSIGSDPTLHAGDRPQVLVPLARLARARPRPLPRLRRGRLSSSSRSPCALPALDNMRTSSGRHLASSREKSDCRGAAAPAGRCAAGSSSPKTEFYATFYCASVTRCYPGRAPSGRGDRTPTPREQELCSFWREWELELLRPGLIVTVGGLALRRLLGFTSLTDCIGVRYELAGTPVVPLPHPSGASGWLNVPANRARLEAALQLVHLELDRLN